MKLSTYLLISWVWFGLLFGAISVASGNPAPILGFVIASLALSVPFCILAYVEAK